MFKKREDTYMTELKDINIINKKPTQNGLQCPQLPPYLYQPTMKAFC